MKLKILFTIFILALIGCLKDDISSPSKEVVSLKNIDTIVNLEGIDLTLVKDFSRSGITNAPLFHVPTLSISHTLLNIFKHEWFTKNGLDSIRMVKTSSGTAILNGITIANYNINLFYKSGVVINLQGYLAKYIGENVKLLPSAVILPLMSLSTTHKRVIAERIQVSGKTVKHIYKPQNTVIINPWRFSSDGIFLTQDYMQPSHGGTSIWSPNHII